MEVEGPKTKIILKKEIFELEPKQDSSLKENSMRFAN